MLVLRLFKLCTMVLGCAASAIDRCSHVSGGRHDYVLRGDFLFSCFPSFLWRFVVGSFDLSSNTSFRFFLVFVNARTVVANVTKGIDIIGFDNLLVFVAVAIIFYFVTSIIFGRIGI